MARPSKNTVNHGAESWDTAINDNFSLIFDTPIPIAVYSSVSAFPSAASYEDCIAIAQDTDQAYISDGSTWALLGGASTFLALADTPSAFTGQAGKVPAVNSAENALEFVSMASGEDISREFYTDFSTSEKDMGMVWHDNKKIYSKVISLGALPDGSSGSTLKTVAHSISGLSEIVRIWGWAEHTDGRRVPLPYMHKSDSASGEEVSLSANNTNVYLRCNGFNASNFTGTVVLWYTKSATGSTDDNFFSFSTSEQRTGLNWIDGRPIYCKVLKDLVGPNGSTSTQVAHGISNLKDVVRMETYYGNTSTWKAPMNGVADNSGSYHRLTYQKMNGTYIEYATESTNWTGHTVGHAILWYTKTDDEVPSPETTFGRDFQIGKEVNTKTKWTDGKYIFKKVINLGTLPNNTSDAIALALNDADTILWVWGTNYNTSDNYFYAHPFWFTQPNAVRYAFDLNKSSIARKDWGNNSNNQNEYLVIYYTKNLPETTQWISNDITLNVNSNGNANGDGSEEAPFDSIQHALDWLANKRILDGVTATIQVANGTYTTSTLTITHPDAKKIKILGDTSTFSGYAITAVNTGSKQFTIAGNHTSEFPTGAYLKVYGSTLNDNMYTVSSSSYSGGNTIIVVNETIQDSTVDGTLRSYNMGVILDFSSSAQAGIELINHSLGQFDGFQLKGSGDTNGKVGIFLAYGATLPTGNNILIHHFQGGINIYFNCNVNAGSIAVAYCGNYGGIKASNSSAISLGDYSASCRISNNGTGFLAETKGEIVANHGIACNCKYGLFARDDALIMANSGNFNYNTADGAHAINSSTFSLLNTIVRYNTTYGIYAYGVGIVSSSGATVSNNGTNFSPTQDTVGNKNSIIYT